MTTTSCLTYCARRAASLNDGNTYPRRILWFQRASCIAPLLPAFRLPRDTEGQLEHSGSAVDILEVAPTGL